MYLTQGGRRRKGRHRCERKILSRLLPSDNTVIFSASSKENKTNLEINYFTIPEHATSNKKIERT